MPSFVLNVQANVRSTNTLVPNFSVLGHVSQSQWNYRAEGFVERSEKMQCNQPEFEHASAKGLVFNYRRHNAFKDQKRYDVMARANVIRQGTYYKYYTTTYDASADPLFKNDVNRVIDRVFDIPVHVGFNPQNELYARFGIQYTTKQEIYVHMGLFLELNYRSLRNAGIKPLCDPNEHNPIWYQRGYDEFRYYGYTAAQIFPKAGDKMKLEFNNKLYNVDSVVDELPEYEYKWRKYWWKLYLDNALDNGMKVSEDVLNNPDQENFINNLLGIGVVGKPGEANDANADNTVNKSPFDVSDTIDELKKSVLFRPPEVRRCVENVTNDPDFYACGALLGQW